MALVRRMTANPIKSAVTITRHKRRKNMATRKRKTGGRRRTRARANPINPVNPTRRRTTRRRGRRSAVYARRRNPINPTRRRRRSLFARSRRRNPVTGLAGRAVPLVLGSAAIGMTAPFLTQIAVRFAPQIVGTPIGIAGVTFGTGWLLSMLAGAFAFTRRWRDDVLLAGAVLAGGQLFTAYVAPMIRIGGGGMGRRGYSNGMRGIGVMTGIPPNMLPAPPPQNGNGMRGVGMRPGSYAR